MPTKDISEMPDDLRKLFGLYGPQLCDAYSGQPISWGYRVLAHLGTKQWAEASQFGVLECAPGNFSWFLITKRLTSDEARTQYGEVTNLELGPRGGFKSVTYGSKRFRSKSLDPRKGEP